MSSLYVKISDIPGESEGYPYNEWIECLGISHAVDLPVASLKAGGRSRVLGESQHGPVILYHRLDKASPALREAVLHHANHLGDVEIDRVLVLDGNTVPVESIRLVNARLVRVDLVTLVDGGTGETGSAFVESFQLAYDEILWTCRRYDSDTGVTDTVEGAWSIPLKTTYI